MAVLDRDISWPFKNCPRSSLKVVEGVSKPQIIVEVMMGLV